jgi:hypothetical protein
LPYEELAPAQRNLVRRIVQQPTLSATGPVQGFAGQLRVYEWLLEHPDKAVRMWQELGAHCMLITDRGDGSFGWNDGEGSDIRWTVIFRQEGLRAWLAEGKARPFAWLPPFPVRAVVVLRYKAVRDASGVVYIYHQAELYFQTDSKAAALVARLIGPSAPRLAEQCVGQLEVFFSGLTWYIAHRPDQAAILFSRLQLSAGG